MFKKILKFIGLGIFASIITIAIFGTKIMNFFDTNKYVLETLNPKYGKGTVIILGLLMIFIISYIALLILILITKLIFKINKKYNIVVAYNWKDFLASISILLMIALIVTMMIEFDSKMIFATILFLIMGIIGIVYYKNRLNVINKMGYKEFNAIWRLITTFVFGIISYPIFIIGLIFNMIKMTPSIVETGVDIASDPIGAGENLETGTYINSDGDAGFYIKNKKGMTLDSDGNITKRVTKDDGTYFDSNGNIGKSKSNKQS